MKKSFVLLIVMMLMVSMVVGCAQKTAPEEVTEPNATEAPVEETAAPEETVDFSETGTLNLDWFAGIGTDSVFECPWADKQNMYPEMVFNTLVNIDTDVVTMLPSLATEWDVSEDGLTYTFTLAEDVKWHDGEPFTVEDVLFTYNTVLKVPESLFKSYFTLVEGVQEVVDGTAETVSGISADGNKVTFKLTAPDNSVVLNAFASIVILPKHLLADVDPTLFTMNEEYWKKPIGTGAYKFNEVSFPNYFSLIRNEDYFGEKAGIKNVMFTSHTTGGVEAQVADIIAGNMDYAFGNAVNDIGTANNILKNNEDIEMVIVPSNYQRQFGFNCVGSSDDKYNDDMQKAEVRQAFNLLIDKQSIAGIYAGQATALTTWVNPQSCAYNSDIPLFERDVETAKQMLTDAGFDFARPVRILYYYNDQTTKDIMDIIVQNFTDAGVTVEPFLATGDLASIIYEVKNWDMMYFGNGLVDPIITYRTLVPGSVVDNYLGNTEERQEKFGTLLSKYKASTDKESMKEYGDQMQLEAYKSALVIPVYGLNKIVLYNSQKVELDETIFDFDQVVARNFKFDTWKLLQE